jgi:hypothetical protein
MKKPAHTIHRLGSADTAIMDDVLNFFGALSALEGGEITGALCAYELRSSSRSAARSISTTWRPRRRIGGKGSPRR